MTTDPDDRCSKPSIIQPRVLSHGHSHHFHRPHAIFFGISKMCHQTKYPEKKSFDGL
ncbi:hypothetical protein [Burkholderia cenocepacia]|uniref:hypothetical protein n=1 Tax=Burkholderia cenocepacia TaxID=95486 RepID=UPI0026562D1A|nr:hypothetical protein [Burkholderia cenocepacia]MDN7453590.1 hypothetical protein [Burkholderia cenocepacia]